MRFPNKLFMVVGIILILVPFICFAEEQQQSKPVLLYGKITTHNINVRVDSAVSSRVICTLNKGESVEVMKESYDWYKIRLPNTAPAFISSSLVEPIDGKTAKVAGDNVNIRLEPDQASPILGRADKNEIINIVEERAGWYKVEPTSGTFGWVHKKFVVEAKPPQKIVKEPPDDGTISLEGIVKPYGMVFRRKGTHKFLNTDKGGFLLKGDWATLNKLNNHKIKVTGKILPDTKNKKYPIIEIQKIEALD